MSVKETIYRKRFNDYYVIAQEFDDGKFGVFILPHNSKVSQLVEMVLTRQHALKGAENLSILYDVATSKGYRLINGSFRNNKGNELDASYAMDLDATITSFSSLFT